MENEKLRAWVYARQGLQDRLSISPRESLLQTGWQRSVGGVNPYLAIFARTGAKRAQVDKMAAGLELYELPSARGCTYVLPADDFSLGLACAKGFSSAAELATARRLGVEYSEINALKAAVTATLKQGAMSPADLKLQLGERVRNLGEEGKKRGMTTTLPLTLGLLQAAGKIRRKPTTGRFDTQKYDYELWEATIGEIPEEAQASAKIARRYFQWIGAATMKEFREFSGFTTKRATLACQEAGICVFDAEAELMGLPGARENFGNFSPPCEPAVSLVGNLDSFLLLRRGSQFWLDDEDRARVAPTDKGMRAVSELTELWSHAILDRGRLIGLWEFDPDAGKIVWHAWTRFGEAARAKIEEMETFVREELGDARSFSLDSPASRLPRLEALRESCTEAEINWLIGRVLETQVAE